MKKKVTTFVIFLMMSMMIVQPVYAASISDIKKQKEETQKGLDNVKGQISDIEDYKDEIGAEIEDTNSSLVEILASISLIEQDIAKKQEEIAAAEIELQAAIDKETAQYNAMKRRIQFMYEKGDISYMQLFMEAKSLNEMLNKADYIEMLYAYDRKMLVDFQETKKEVASLKAALEDERSELEAVQHEYEEEKASLEVILTEKRAEFSNFEHQLEKARQDAKAYEAKIKAQNDQIKKLEAEEEAKRAAANKNNNKVSSGNVGRVDPAIITNATGSALGKEIATHAIKFVGNPYVAGGTSLTNGADCSGFTYAVYKDFGYSIPRNSTAQRSAGREVDFASAEPGDLICYAGHVGMYIGGGKIVHASTERTGIKISNVTYRPILGVRRIV